MRGTGVGGQPRPAHLAPVPPPRVSVCSAICKASSTSVSSERSLDSIACALDALVGNAANGAGLGDPAVASSGQEPRR